MIQFSTVLLCLLTLLSSMSIAIRHDVDDHKYLELGEVYPSVVRVGENGGDGTLIDPSWVLTAAHVAAGMTRRTNGNLKVFTDDHPEGIAVAQVIIHPDFIDMGPHDIALLRLTEPVTTIKPAGLYRDLDELNQPIVIVGHGDTKNGKGGPWKVDGLRRGATNIIDAVNDHHINFDFDAPGEATELEGTAGPGDSGGPAFIERDGQVAVAGVSSLGQPGEDGPGTYGALEFYVRVSSYVAWIDAMLANPPTERLVNMPAPRERGRVVTGSPGGGGPPGVLKLEEIGLLVGEQQGQVRMVGRIDELYPAVLLDAGIRPPAAVTKLQGEDIDSLQDLESRFEEIQSGSTFTITFEKAGRSQKFELVK